MEEENLGFNIQKVEEPSKPVSILNDKVPQVSFKVDESKSLQEQAKEAINFAATQKALDDEKLVGEITDLKKDELKANATASLKEEQAKGKEADTKLQNATFGVFQGMAELIGLKKSLPKPVLDILMCVVGVFLTPIMVVLGLITGTINVIMDSVNSIVKRFAEFTDSAKKVIIFVLIAGLASGILLVVYWVLKKYGIITF